MAVYTATYSYLISTLVSAHKDEVCETKSDDSYEQVFSHPVRVFEASTLNETADTVEMEEIPPEMIINWDQTGVKTVPSNTRTIEKQGTK